MMSISRRHKLGIGQERLILLYVLKLLFGENDKKAIMGILLDSNVEENVLILLARTLFLFGLVLYLV